MQNLGNKAFGNLKIKRLINRMIDKLPGRVVVIPAG
jgi:hypothetical protein